MRISDWSSDVCSSDLYALTLRQWYARTLAHEGEITAMMGDRFFRMWCFSLAGATSAFESGGMGNYQIQFARSRHALPLTRDYMGEAELRYVGSRSFCPSQLSTPSRSRARKSDGVGKSVSV